MKDINSYKYKKNLVYPINEARNTWGTLRPTQLRVVNISAPTIISI